MKRIISKLVVTLAIAALCIVPTFDVYAANSNVESSEPIVETLSDDGWSSGGFYFNYTTGIKYFSGGTIYVSINSSNSYYSGTYTVQLLKGSTVQGTLTVPANGIATVNFPNQSSGNYRLKFTSGDNTSYQSYTILSYGTI